MVAVVDCGGYCVAMDFVYCEVVWPIACYDDPRRKIPRLAHAFEFMSQFAGWKPAPIRMKVPWTAEQLLNCTMDLERALMSVRMQIEASETRRPYRHYIASSRPFKQLMRQGLAKARAKPHTGIQSKVD
jgi:hypothetical protein